MRYIILLLFLILLITFGLSDTILYGKEGFITWIPYILIFFVIPFLIYKSIDSYKVRKDISLGIAIGSVLIIGPLFGIWTEHLSDKDLSENGIITKGIVIEKTKVRKHKSYNYKWIYRAEFKVSDQDYITFTKDDERNIVNEGDTVIVKYSKRNPENNTIIVIK